MYTVFAQIVRMFSIRPTVQKSDNPAQQLMHSAGACVGNSPHHAQELREAAYAYLRVVR